MKLINKKTDYAIRALMELAKSKSGEVLSSSEVSTKQNIPKLFLRAILQKLCKAKIVFSKEGALGGVKLAKNPEGIRVLQVIKLFQGDIKISECLFRKKLCPNRKFCPLRTHILKIEKDVKTSFEKITIASLIKKTKEK